MNTVHLAKKIKTISKHFWPLTPWTIFFAILVLMLCAEASALIIQHTHSTTSKPQTAATTSPAPQVSTTKTIVSMPTPSTATSTPTPTQAAPVNTCSSSSTATLSQTYKTTDATFVDTTKGILSNDGNGSITDTQAVDQFNQAIVVVNGAYSVAYSEYVAAQHASDCAVSVSARTSVPLCYPANLNSLSVTTCISNTHLED